MNEIWLVQEGSSWYSILNEKLVYVTKGVGVKLSVVLVKVSQALSDFVEYRGFGW